MGLAPILVREIFTTLSALKARGLTILLVEQNARLALQVADFAYVMENGNIALQGSSGNVLDDPKVIEAYLGR
jgi:branched-chain amino acid transport system ATP-binding protein